MKSEKEFLDGMWEKVSKIEFDEIEKEKVLIYNKQIKRENLYIKSVVSVSIILALVLIGHFINNINLTLTGGVVAISIATFYELNYIEIKCLKCEEGVVDFGNSN